MEKLKSHVSQMAYDKTAAKALDFLYGYLENVGACGDLDLKNGILNYTIDGVGEYVFNKQPPLRQLWASSPLSGPKRFFMGEDSRWYDTKTKKELKEYIRDEVCKLNSILGKE
jgi:frataxin